MVVGVVWGVAYPCCHPTGGERGEAVLVVDPAHANHVHHVGWIIKSTERREGEGERGREREGGKGRERKREGEGGRGREREREDKHIRKAQ